MNVAARWGSKFKPVIFDAKGYMNPAFASNAMQTPAVAQESTHLSAQTKGSRVYGYMEAGNFTPVSKQKMPTLTFNTSSKRRYALSDHGSTDSLSSPGKKKKSEFIQGGSKGRVGEVIVIHSSDSE